LPNCVACAEAWFLLKRQAAVIMATVLLQAAESDTPMPRNVLP
jgi:hypothetical protein